METRLKILLVEDNLLDAELFRSWLEEEQLPVELALARNQADYEAAVTSHREWDAIVSDNGFPVYDGISALRFKGANLPEVPFIFFTGSPASRESIDSLRQLGATDYVMKTQPKQIIAILRGLLEKK